MDEKIKAAEATPKRVVWRVCRGGVCVGNYPEDQYEKAADHLLRIFKPKFMEEAAGYVKKPYGTETFRRELPSIEINASYPVRIRHRVAPLQILNHLLLPSAARTGMRVSQQMLRNRWDDAREAARSLAASEGRVDDAEKIQQFQFRDIRPKAASEITDIADASLLLGHSEQEITKRVYRRIGAVAQPSK